MLLESKGQVVCWDSQGIKTKEGYFLLIDPNIDSMKKLYGNSDRGHAGINMFLKNHQHKCGETCRKLDIEKTWYHGA